MKEDILNENEVAKATCENEVKVIEGYGGLPYFKVGERVVEVDIDSFEYSNLLDEWVGSDNANYDCKKMLDAYVFCEKIVDLLEPTDMSCEVLDTVKEELNGLLMDSWRRVYTYLIS